MLHSAFEAGRGGQNYLRSVTKRIYKHVANRSRESNFFVRTHSMAAGADFGREQQIILEGPLDKRGEWNKAWKTRYFVLESSGKLSYFQSEADKNTPSKAKGSIPINTGMTVKEGSPSEGRSVIEIVVPGSGLTPKRTFVIGCESQENHAQWMDSLTKLQKRVHYVTFQDNVRHW